MRSAIAVRGRLLAAALIVNAAVTAAGSGQSARAVQPAARPDCSARISILPTYDDRSPGTVRHDKLSLSATCTITLLTGLTAEATAYAFPIASQQQRWDPDFSFAAQYVLTPKVWLRYSNYTGNRWPWHNAAGNGSLARGTIAAYVALPSPGPHVPSCNASLSVAPQFERGGWQRRWEDMAERRV